MNLIPNFKNRILFLFVLFLLFDISYSFVQYYTGPIGGDIAEVVIPQKDNGYYQALHDPFGYDILTKNESYGNPNRFFAHSLTSNYFLYIPKILQNFTTPINSIYLSIAFSKIATHLLFLVLFFYYILDTKFRVSKENLLIACLSTPFFQTYGFNRYIGIIDQSVVYNFFYALPTALFLIAFFPVYRFFVFNKSTETIPYWKKTLLILFVPVITLNGPLIPGIVVVTFILFSIYSLIRIYKSRKEKSSWIQRLNPFNLTPFLFVLLIAFVLFSLFSLYLGQYNSLNKLNQISLLDRYSRLPLGLYYILTQKIGYFLLLISIGINFLVLHYSGSEIHKQKAFTLLKWIGLFSLFYILLLPLGGYRSYRSNIIRYDTILPITLFLIFVFVYSSFILLNLTNFKHKTFFNLYLILLIGFYTFSDQLNPEGNKCERNLLTQLSKSKENKINLPSDCLIMEWNSVQDYKQSELNARLLKHWGVTDSLVLYRQK